MFNIAILEFYQRHIYTESNKKKNDNNHAGWMDQTILHRTRNFSPAKIASKPHFYIMWYNRFIYANSTTYENTRLEKISNFDQIILYNVDFCFVESKRCRMWSESQRLWMISSIFSRFLTQKFCTRV